jgi:hypothetical protein
MALNRTKRGFIMVVGEFSICLLSAPNRSARKPHHKLIAPDEAFLNRVNYVRILEQTLPNASSLLYRACAL